MLSLTPRRFALAALATAGLLVFAGMLLSLAPREFLPLVREHGLMDALTDVVLSRAVADASGWYEAGNTIPVAINLWARSLDEDTLPDRIMSVLNAYSMSASSLTIEITEDLVVADLSKGRAVLNRLRDFGIRVAIDDFGSGYSTLTYLRELPIDDVSTINSSRRSSTIDAPRQLHGRPSTSPRPSASPVSPKASKTGKQQ